MFRLKAVLFAAPVAAGLLLAGTPAQSAEHGGGGGGGRGFHGGGGGFHGGGAQFHGNFGHDRFRRGFGGFGSGLLFGFGAGALLAAPYYYGWPPVYYAPPPYYPPPGCYPPPPGYPPGCYPPPPGYYPPG
jgi:hypothetical protein